MNGSNWVNGLRENKMNKRLIILAIAVLFICVGLSGCNELSGIKAITVSGMDTEQTINYLDEPVKLIVSGMDCNITVSKETNLVEVIISGMDSIVRVSRSHSFTSTISGMGAQIVYYD